MCGWACTILRIHLPSTIISCIFPTVNSNFPIEAVHTYSSASSGWMFVSLRVPPARTRALPVSRSPPDFDHFMWGCMLAVAWQRTDLSVPLVTNRTSGGLTGTWITWSFVLERSDARRFFAVHLYSPSSSFVTLKSFNFPSSTTTWGDKLPPSFDHSTSGVGEPVTWHFGRVMVVFSLAYVGPYSRWMRGSAAVELKTIKTILIKTYRQPNYFPTPPPTSSTSPPLPPFILTCRSSERFRTRLSFYAREFLNWIRSSLVVLVLSPSFSCLLLILYWNFRPIQWISVMTPPTKEITAGVVHANCEKYIFPSTILFNYRDQKKKTPNICHCFVNLL